MLLRTLISLQWGVQLPVRGSAITLSASRAPALQQGRVGLPLDHCLQGPWYTLVIKRKVALPPLSDSPETVEGEQPVHIPQGPSSGRMRVCLFPDEDRKTVEDQEALGKASNARRISTVTRHSPSTSAAL